MEWLESSTVPPQISTYYYITPVRHPYEAIKWSLNLLMGHYLLVEPRIGLSLKELRIRIGSPSHL